MIALCLQCCPLDLGATFELVQLICELEKHKRENTEFFLIYRKDVPLWVPKEFQRITEPHFARAQACMARNHDTGWPGGSNMLAFSAMMEMEILRRDGTFKNDAFLLFEPDCVPLSFDWMDRLTQAWEHAHSQGKEATGHWHQQGDETTLHMNGNAIFSADFYDKHPNLMVGTACQGWDYWFRDKIIPLSCDTDLIFQQYNRASITLEELDALRKNGNRPVFLHGIKDSSARRNVHMMLFANVSA